MQENSDTLSFRDMIKEEKAVIRQGISILKEQSARKGNSMYRKLENKKTIFFIIWILIGILSFTVVSKYAASPESHQATIESLDEKKTTVLELTMATTATSALITLLPGDIGTPIAEKITDLSSYLLIVLCAIFLEKYLVTITGYAAFKIFVPVACILFAVNLLSCNQSIDRLARKLFVFGLCIFLVVPASVKVSDLIEQTYHAQIEATLEEAKGTEDLSENNAEAKNNPSDTENGGFWQKAKNAIADAKDSVSGAVENISISSEELVQKVESSLSHFVEAVAVMLITSCVIPVLVLLVFFWLIKIFIDVDFSAAFPKRKETDQTK